MARISPTIIAAFLWPSEPPRSVVTSLEGETLARIYPPITAHMRGLRTCIIPVMGGPVVSSIPVLVGRVGWGSSQEPSSAKMSELSMMNLQLQWVCRGSTSALMPSTWMAAESPRLRAKPASRSLRRAPPWAISNDA
jgi:hypothetical protein